MIETCQHYVYNNREQTKKKRMIDDSKYHLLMFVRVYLLKRKKNILMIKHSCMIEKIFPQAIAMKFIFDDNLIVVRLRSSLSHIHITRSTYQLLTCRILRLVSRAKIFFCSSDGYGCYTKRKRLKDNRRDIYLHLNVEITKHA